MSSSRTPIWVSEPRCRTTMVRLTDSRRARNSASETIAVRRRPDSRPSRRRCFLASIRVEPLTAVTSSLVLSVSPSLRRRRRRRRLVPDSVESSPVSRSDSGSDLLSSRPDSSESGPPFDLFFPDLPLPDLPLPPDLLSPDLPLPDLPLPPDLPSPFFRSLGSASLSESRESLALF